MFGRGRGQGNGRGGRGGGRGRGRGRGGGLPRECICPQCKTVVPHQPGVPCFQRICPNCKIPMMGRLRD